LRPVGTSIHKRAEKQTSKIAIYDGSLLSAIVLGPRNHDAIHIIDDVIKILPIFISVKVLNLS
jgi:hypothetical protein